MSDRRLRPLPDEDTAPYWKALAEGRLDVQRCRDCRQWTWPPRPICSKCHSDDLAFEPVSGLGEVYSWIVVHRSTMPHLAAYVPYVLAVVRLDEQADIYIPGRLLGDAEPRRGLRVRAVADAIDEETGELSWTLAD